jgi:hypothetical protein
LWVLLAGRLKNARHFLDAFESAFIRVHRRPRLVFTHLTALSARPTAEIWKTPQIMKKSLWPPMHADERRWKTIAFAFR